MGAVFNAFRKHPNCTDAFTQEMLMALVRDNAIEVEWRERVDSKLDEIPSCQSR